MPNSGAQQLNVEPKVVNRRDAGRMLGGVSYKTIDNLIREEKLEMIEVGGQRKMVTVASINRFIDSQPRVKPENQPLALRRATAAG